MNVQLVFDDLRAGQHGVAAVWQLLQRGVQRKAVENWIQRARPARLHRGVYGEPGPLGHLMAAALALGPAAAVSHLSGLSLWGLRPHQGGPIHVSVPGRGGRKLRDAIVVHRPLLLDRENVLNIPVMTPTRCLQDVRLRPHALYRALEQAADNRLRIDWPALDSPLLRRLRALHGRDLGRTRSDAEARFLLLCEAHGLRLPLVNRPVNGLEADFHWPAANLVVEVDGWEFHRDRRQFEEDRRRTLIHTAAGFSVVRASALQVQHEPGLVLAALAAAAPSVVPRRTLDAA